MELKYSIKRVILVLSVLALVSITAVAQENRSEISIQGTGFFTYEQLDKTMAKLLKNYPPKNKEVQR